MVSWTPKMHIVTDITVSTQAIVTTEDDHDYQTNDYVLLNCPSAYGMELNNVQSKITVLSSTTFQTEIDTSNQLPFSLPALENYTQAQVSSIAGQTFYNNTPGSPS